ncbi:MAG: hypothetical protein QG602_3295 [Verrucomicrobiota bacterium]|nr:hypothetical protein [Verrucomicrobiota bacterium]
MSAVFLLFELLRRAAPGWRAAGLIFCTATGLAADDPSGGVITGATAYFDKLSAPGMADPAWAKDFPGRRGEIRGRLLRSIALDPLPERVAMDARFSAVLDHPWARIRQVAYQLWPGVYSTALLYEPKNASGRLPAILTPTGHYGQFDNAYVEVQEFCLNLVRQGYLVLSTAQNHYEDLSMGISHQTVMVWTNMRALDLLEAMPNVDRERIGVAGASGGGLQTEMLVALDSRPRAASIIGFTCEFRTLLYPDPPHCDCNHFPGLLRDADHPQISALRFPIPMQFVTMNDWTVDFRTKNFPSIKALYESAGAGDRVAVEYFPSSHAFERPKREAVYRWLARWLQPPGGTAEVAEPETTTFTLERLLALRAEVETGMGFGGVLRHFEARWRYQPVTIGNSRQLADFQNRLSKVLARLAGSDAVLPVAPGVRPVEFPPAEAGGCLVNRVLVPGEGGLVIPALEIKRRTTGAPRRAVLYLSPGDKNELVSPVIAREIEELLAGDTLVVIPDFRGKGELEQTWLGRSDYQEKMWERNGIVWGRPIAAMAATDISSVIDHLLANRDITRGQVSIVARKSGEAALVGLLAAAMDQRVAKADLDLKGACFQLRNLPPMPFILQHGDVLQIAALIAPRSLVLRGVPPEAGLSGWLQAAYQAAGARAKLDLPNN